MNALENNAYTQRLTHLTQSLPAPKTILAISAHWETRGTWVTAMPTPRTLHDFGGFPKQLFEVQYPAPGDLELAKRVLGLFNLTNG